MASIEKGSIRASLVNMGNISAVKGIVFLLSSASREKL